MMVHLDTHCVLWLYEGARERFSKKAASRIEESRLSISPAVLLELQYLFEIEKITVPAQQIFTELKTRIDIDVLTEKFLDVVIIALSEHWTRDPFDRLIASHAKLMNAPLLTKDSSVRRHYGDAVW
ncbi:MAG: PIN domain-containing protein [Deltaproteobacteria bacterium]|nr:PIN domain-containing protein [Deltaproteobacteria bacterium]